MTICIYEMATYVYASNMQLQDFFSPDPLVNTVLEKFISAEICTSTGRAVIKTDYLHVHSSKGKCTSLARYIYSPSTLFDSPNWSFWCVRHSCDFPWNSDRHERWKEESHTPRQACLKTVNVLSDFSRLQNLGVDLVRCIWHMSWWWMETGWLVHHNSCNQLIRCWLC